MLNTGHTRGLVSASGSRSPGLFPGLSRFAGTLLQGTATEPFSLHPRHTWKTFSRGMLLGEVSH